MASGCTSINNRPIFRLSPLGQAVEGALTELEPYIPGYILAVLEATPILVPASLESTLHPLVGKRIYIGRMDDEFRAAEVA